MKPLVIINIILLATLLITAYLYWHNASKGEVIQGDDWTAKRYGSTYIVSINNQSELVAALNNFIKTAGITLGTVNGIGAVNQATLRFFDPQTKNYVDKTFSQQMEIANLTGNISTKDGKEYTHYHVTLGDNNYNAMAGHLLEATINGAGEFVINAIPNGHLERNYNDEVGLNFYDFKR